MHEQGVGGTPKVRGSEGLPSRAYSLAGKTRVRAHIRENNTVHLAVPFQFIKHPHTSLHKRGGKGLVLFSRCGNLLEDNPSVSGKDGHVAQGSLWLQTFTALSGKGM